MAGDWVSVVSLIFPLLACLSNAQDFYPGPSYGNVWSPGSAGATGRSMSGAGTQVFRPPFPASYPTHGPQAPASPRPVFTPRYSTLRPTSKPQAHATLRPVVTPRYPTGRPTSRPQFPASPRPGFGATKVVPEPVKTEVVTPRPVRPDSVKAFCGENSVQVEAQMDLFGIGQVIQPSDITLGGCGPTGQDGSAQVLVFETELQGCGSTLTVR